MKKTGQNRLQVKRNTSGKNNSFYGKKHSEETKKKFKSMADAQERGLDLDDLDTLGD